MEAGEILFDPEQAQHLFEEAGVLFAGQIKRTYEQLIEFNRSITEERRLYLQEELKEIEQKLQRVNADLNTLGKKRSEALAFLGETDVFDKYKQISNELVILRADIIALEKQRSVLQRLQELRAEIRVLADERGQLQAKIESDVELKNSSNESLFSTIRLLFNEIIESVINRSALISVAPNVLGHLDFKAEILDAAGNTTSADRGHSYRKLLCVAFDFALLRAWGASKFPRFAYHDGVFESLDDRKKENLLSVLREYAVLGFQPIITLIDSDLPLRSKDEPIFSDDEVIKLLHDEGNDGRLFNMSPW